MRYYYKAKNGKGYMNLKSPYVSDDFEEITKEQFEAETTQVPQVESTPVEATTAEAVVEQPKKRRSKKTAE